MNYNHSCRLVYKKETSFNKKAAIRLHFFGGGDLSYNVLKLEMRKVYALFNLYFYTIAEVYFY